MTRARTLAVLLAGAAILAVPGTAAAGGDPRYASPTGSGTECTEAAPCSLQTAITEAPGDNFITVAPGDYGSEASPITTSLLAGVVVHVGGVEGQPRPRIFTSGTSGLSLTNDASTIRHVAIEVRDPGEIGLDFRGTLADDVIAHRTGTTNGAACLLAKSAKLRNSVCWSESETSFSRSIWVEGAVRGPNTVTLRNVTAVAPGSQGIGLDATSGTDKNSDVTVVNSIIQGTPAIATSQAGGGAVNVTASYSNVVGSVDTFTNGGSYGFDETMVTDPVLFVNSVGDFHQRPTSPTIDKGTDIEELGATDFDAHSRVFGAAVDIGADEFVASHATTGAATQVGRPRARVAGTFITQNVAGGKAFFRYGKTAAYGSRTPNQSLGASNAVQARNALLTGLTPGTTYHYRAVLEGPGGNTVGPDRTFRTLPPFSGLTIPKQTVTVRQGVARVSVACPAAIGSCHGPLKLSRKNKKGKTPKRIALGTANFNVPSGRTATIPVPLNDAARARLKDKGKIAARARSDAVDDVGARRPRTGEVKLLKAQPPKAAALSR